VAGRKKKSEYTRQLKTCPNTCHKISLQSTMQWKWMWSEGFWQLEVKVKNKRSHQTINTKL
jgi:hypothetical protein